MKKYILYLLAMVCIVEACRKNTDELTLTEKGPIQGDKVESIIYGKVLYGAGNPVENATVTIGGVAYKTNARGEFWSKKQLFDSKGTLVRVSATYYFDAFVFAFPHLNSETYIEVQMNVKQSLGSFEAADGVKFPQFSGGAGIEIPANAIAKSDGSPYQGQVKMYGVWLDPTYEWTFQLMPGDLRAIDAAGDPKILKTYGMIGVELETPDGEKLNLLAGKTAKITFPLPPSIKISAPSTIQLWHFNTDNGYWVESGTAPLVNGSYEAEVSHFSFWNCDIPEDFIFVTMKFVDTNGNVGQNLTVQLTSQNYNTGTDYSDDQGRIGGLVPKGEILQMKVIHHCGNVVYEGQIGPFSTDRDLGKFTTQAVQLPQITGILLDCDGAPVQQGIITLSIENDTVQVYAITEPDGQFSFIFPYCDIVSTFQITGYNLQALKESIPTEINIAGNSINVGTIQACAPLDEYATFTCNGFQQTFVFYPDFLAENGAEKTIRVYGTGLPGSTIGGTEIKFSFDNVAPNQSTASLIDFHAISLENDQLRNYGCTYCPTSGCGCLATDANPILFTSYANNFGEYISGTVSGNVRADQDQTMQPFTLEFKVKRKL
jgi:hypothetical protein